MMEIKLGVESLKAVEGLSDFIKTVKDATADGFQPGGDIPEIATSALTDLLPIMSNISEIKKEIEENPDSRTILVALLINDLMDIFS